MPLPMQMQRSRQPWPALGVRLRLHSRGRRPSCCDHLERRHGWRADGTHPPLWALLGLRFARGARRETFGPREGATLRAAHTTPKPTGRTELERSRLSARRSGTSRPPRSTALVVARSLRSTANGYVRFKFALRTCGGSVSRITVSRCSIVRQRSALLMCGEFSLVKGESPVSSVPWSPIYRFGFCVPWRPTYAPMMTEEPYWAVQKYVSKAPFRE